MNPACTNHGEAQLSFDVFCVTPQAAMGNTSLLRFLPRVIQPYGFRETTRGSSRPLEG
jgi:hypothetical protein